MLVIKINSDDPDPEHKIASGSLQSSLVRPEALLIVTMSEEIEYWLKQKWVPKSAT